MAGSWACGLVLLCSGAASERPEDRLVKAGGFDVGLVLGEICWKVLAVISA